MKKPLKYSTKIVQHKNIGWYKLFHPQSRDCNKRKPWANDLNYKPCLKYLFQINNNEMMNAEADIEL